MDPLIRRHEPRGALRTLPAYLDQWGPCVQVTASTPLQGPVAAIHDAYLLRITSELSEGITGYSTAATDDVPQDVQLMYVLYWMDVLDQLWVARLEQRVTELDRVKEGACAHFPTPDKADQVAAVLQTSAAVSSSEAWQAGPSDKSVPPYGTTDRIRLRDEMCNARERLFAWMRSQKGLAPPPTTVDPWPSTHHTLESSADAEEREARLEAEEEEEAETWAAEHLAPPASDEDRAEERAEDDHYAKLFDRALDPDASDEEPPAKRTKRSGDTDGTEMAFWDQHFASLFARSLHHLTQTPM